MLFNVIDAIRLDFSEFYGVMWKMISHSAYIVDL